ncbi:hypothetical protein ACQI5H_23875 [Mycobacterium heidelbergense]|uniref:hypothetical protein n=1 Tax=Mycobacterium heidelbergense TaxID=53376 RepID=UPI003CEFE14E
MNTSTNINQTHAPTTSTARTTASGFRRRTMAGVLLAMGITATAVGFAATSHADEGAPAPAPAVTAPAPATPWLPTIDRFWGGYRHLQCGFPGWRGPFQCWY